ncbi:MAG TPA: ClbS/DfsB family four-helix bundle protein [Ktedonobacteraceae bacterium]
MDKAQLLEEMSNGYITLENILAPLNRAQMTTPGVNGDWSIKDILAHLNAWQGYLVIRLQAAARDEAPAVQGVISDEDEGNTVDRLNADFYEESKSRSLDEVLAEFRATYRQIVEAVQALSDEDLFERKRFSWTKGNALWELVPGDTYEHYQEHIGSIREWLGKVR